MKHFKLGIIFLLVMSSIVNANDRLKSQQNDARNKTGNELMETMIQNEADGFEQIQNAIYKWFFEGNHQSRVLLYNTPYELPMDEIKSDGYLSQFAFLREPGGVVGEDEATALLRPYTLKIMKIAGASGDQYKMIALTGEKATVLPPAFVPSCYVYATYRLDGVVTGWNWHQLPSNAGAVLPFNGQTCADVGIFAINNLANYVRSQWASYIPPGLQPNVAPSCNVVNTFPAWVTPPGSYSDVAICSFAYNTPATPTYCNAELHLSRLSGPTDIHALSSLSVDCTNSALPGYRILSDSKITSLGLDANPSTCLVLNSHYIRCISSEIVVGCAPNCPPPPPSAKCEVFVYDQEGILPPVRTHFWDDRDCTGAYDATKSILEWLQYDKHYNNVFALLGNGNVDLEKVHSNEFCEYHLNNSGSLGNQFADDTYYNCGFQNKIDEFIQDYNVANPSSQIRECEKYTGILIPGEVEHKAICEPLDTTINVVLEPGPFDSEWVYVPYDPNGDPAAGGNYDTRMRILPLTGNGGSNNGMVESHIISVGDNNGDTYDIYYNPWITIEPGSTINDLLTAGYTYNLSYSLSQKSATNIGDLTCTATGSGNLISGIVLFEADMFFQQNDDYGVCKWTGTISEYKDGTATGKTQVVQFELQLIGSN